MLVAFNFAIAKIYYLYLTNRRIVYCGTTNHCHSNINISTARNFW